MAVNYIKPLSSIQGAITNDGWFFNEGQLTGIGNRLYNTYKNSAPAALNVTSLDNGNLTVSHTGNIYIGAYKSCGSRGYEETYFAFFYYKSGNTEPTLTLTFKNGFIDDLGNLKPLTLNLTVCSDSDNGSSTSLIPFFAFEAQATMQQSQTAVGWLYSYIYTVNSSWTGGITANVASSAYNLKIKVKYTSGTKTNPIPILICDMNNPQKDLSETSASSYRQPFSESCYIPTSITNIYTGCDEFTYNGSTYSSVSTVECTERSSTYTYVPEGYNHFHGTMNSNGYNRGEPYPWPSGFVATGIPQELNCGIGFIAPLGTEFYVAGSRGVSQLFPPFSPEFVTVVFNKQSSESFDGLTFTDNKASTEVHLEAQFSRGGWPGEGTRTGYTFNGWYTSSSGGTKINASTVVSSSTYSDGDTINLYSRFSPTQYTITYNSNGGSSVTSQNYTIETNLSLKAAPTKSGYTFNGWKVTSASGNWTSGASFNASQNIGTGKYGNITLTAQWTANTYTIEFVIATANYPTSSDGDAGNVPSKPANRTVTYGGTWAGDGYNSLPGLSTASGSSDNWDDYFDAWKWNYGFVGWFTAETGGVEKTATTTYDVAGNSTLYARWEKTQNKYDVTWNDWNGTELKKDTNVPAGTLIQSLAPADPVRNGYVFSGWQDMPSYSEVRDNYTFTAQYTPIQYTVTFVYNNPSYATIDASSKETSPFYYTIEQDPSAFRNPTTSDNTSAHNANPYAFDGWTWSIAKHADDVNTPPTPTGWTAGSKLTTADIPSGTWGNITLTATWTPNPFTISFDVNLGENDEYQTQSPVDTPNPITVNFGSAYGVPTLSRTGYDFNGWYTESEGGTLIESSTRLTTAKNHTLYAHWTIKTTALVFHTKDGATQPESVILTIESAYPYVITQKSEMNNREFVGWWSAPTGGTQVTKVDSWPSSTVNVYARFKVALVPFDPIPDQPGYNDDPLVPDNNDYGIPIEDLDPSLNYRLVLTVVGDRTNGTTESDSGVFQMPAGTGTITRFSESDNRWVWKYDTGIISSQELEDLMEEVIFTMNVWRVQVWHPTATLKVELSTYDGNTQLGTPSTTNNDFTIGDEYIPYVSPDDEGSESDVLLKEGVDAIRALDLYGVIGTPSALINAGSYEQIKDSLYTRRFIGNKRSTVMCRIKAHSMDENGNERLYGAVPEYVTVMLTGDGYEHREPYDLAELGIQFEPNDEPNHSYVSSDFPVSYDPFPNIVHNEQNDLVNGTFKIQVLDSRHFR